MNPALPICSDCGAAISHAELGSRCPACLLRLALTSDPGDPGLAHGRSPSTPAPGSHPDLAPGERIGDFVIVRELARGGMGIVYLARHRNLNRLVALKRMISPRLAGPELLWRFRVETEAIARLDHPNIVPLYETGDYEGLPYFTTRFGATLSPNDQWLATGSDDARARVWNVASGQLLTDGFRHNARVQDVSFDPAGTRIVTASADGTARIWDLRNPGAPPVTIHHSTAVLRASFGPRGHWILTVSQANQARLWDARMGLPVSEPFSHRGAVTNAQFARDGRRVLTASEDGSARVWNVPVYRPSDAAWLPDLAEAIGRMRLNAPGDFRVTDASRWPVNR